MPIFALLIASGASVPGVYYAFQHSDGVGKGIVLLLLVGSVVTWTVMLDKTLALRRAKKMSGRFIARFRANKRNVATPSLVREGQVDTSPVGIIYSGAVQKLLEFYEVDSLNQQPIAGATGARPVKLSDAQYNAIEAMLESEVSGQIQVLETRVGVLATLVSVSPFIGLFGTVWGVMLAFCGIAAAGKSDFSALAPGVAGALLTTVAGLVVAIPSLVGYNLLTATIRNLIVTMDNFTEEFMVRVKLEQLQLGREQHAAAAAALPQQPNLFAAPPAQAQPQAPAALQQPNLFATPPAPAQAPAPAQIPQPSLFTAPPPPNPAPANPFHPYTGEQPRNREE